MNFLGNNIKKHFPIFSHNENIVYCDNASTVHKPKYVINAMNDYIENSYSNIHRGSYALAETSELLYKNSKKKVAQLIGGDYREIIYTYNATYASNILAQSLVKTYNIGKGDTVLIGIWDHHATIVPRQLLSQQYGFQIKFINLEKTTLDIDWVQLSESIEHYRPKVVICSHVSNVTGIVYDIQRIASVISSISGFVFFAVDGSQAIPHMKVNVNTIGCNAYFFTGHKMMGPTGIGVLWIEKILVRELQTLLGGGGIIESVNTDTCSLIRTADKFEPGTPNLIGAIGLGAACDFYNNENIYAYIHDYENHLYKMLVEGLKEINSIDLLLGGDSLNNCGIVSFSIDNPLECAEYLADHNICVRAGGHCAHPLLHYLGKNTGVVRISPFIYNTFDDIEYIINAINDYVS